MASEWKTAKVAEVAEKVGMGPFGSSIKVETFVPYGIPVISGQHLRGNRLIDSDFNFVTLEHATRLANSNVFRGDVVFTHAGNIGQVAFIPHDSKYERYIISQRQFYLRCNTKKALPEFVTYYFKSPEGQHKLLANTSSSGVPSIAQPVSYLRTIEIPVPPLPEQRAIAAILGAFDDKIELNRRMNRTLEEMARALFKSWFVDFDPVRAKAEGRDPGLPAELAALFPAGFEETELGEVPRGWGVGTVSDIAAINARTVKNKAPDEVIEYVDISSVSPGRIDTVVKYDFGAAPSRARRLVEDGDVIWSCVRPNRRAYALLDTPPDNMVVSTGFAVLTAVKVPPTYLYHWLTTADFVEYLTANADGSAYPAVRAEHFARAEILQPSINVATEFNDIIRPLHRRIAANERENRSLAQLRDTLLPKLLSGEVRVAEAAALV